MSKVEAQKFAEEDSNLGMATAIKRRLQQSLAFASLVAIFIFFAFANPAFATLSNINGILLSTAVIGLLAVGTTFVIITAGIDLSIGTGVTLTAVMTAYAIKNLGLPVWLGVVVGIVTGALMGLVNGLNITYLQLPPFIATLAMMLIAKGLALVISGTAPIYVSGIGNFEEIALGSIVPGWNTPNAVVILFVSAVVASFILNRTVLGRYTFAIGSNEEATAISGINVRKWKIIIYIVGGIFIGLAGVVLTSRLGSAQPALGMGYELEAIAAVIIGGTSLMGGRGSILGTVIGALIMSVLINGLRIMSIQQEWQTVVVGFVIIFAVYTDSLRRRRGL
ncbi:MAG: Ribose import permease protein RbsC [Actinomycetota bacterium]|jgi:ribose transport system permease protein